MPDRLSPSGERFPDPLLLEQTLKEEKETNQKLTDLSEEINPQAFTGKSSEGEEREETKVKHRAAKAGGSR